MPHLVRCNPDANKLCTERPKAVPPIGTLMMIDDNEVDHVLCKRVVDRAGCVQHYVSHKWAEDALESLLHGPPVDMILLDVNMPQMDGFEFLEAATRLIGPEFVPMVALMLTMDLSPQQEKLALSMPQIKAFVPKPLQARDLHGLAEQLDKLPTLSLGLAAE